MRWMVFALTLFCLAAGSAALAERRVAFVVGNGAYENTAPLRNPANDASLIAATLEGLDFEVTLHIDLTRAAFARALSDHLRATDGADVSLFYFAGHGIQFDGQNYLLGTDASLQSEFDLAGETIALDAVVEALERRSDATLVFVDACRDNPLAETFYAENFADTRSLATRGLAEVRSAVAGTMLMFAASPGQVAYDGAGPNSPFSLALARHLPAANTEVLSLMKRVIRDTRTLTSGRQSPTVVNDLARDVFLRRVAAIAPEISLADRAADAWRDFRDSTSVEALEQFTREFPGTPHAALARDRALRLRAREDEAGGRSTAASVEAAVEPPEWCAAPEGHAQLMICREPALLAQEARVARLYRARLDRLRGGDAYGEVLMAQAAWSEARDACADEACLVALYERRAIELMGLPEGLTPDEQVVYLVQTELNRLSCGAGAPDGQAGPRTRSALARLADETDSLSASADPASVVTLTTLRDVPDGVCSVLFDARTAPRLLGGIWRLTTTCDGQFMSPMAEGTYVGAMVVEHVGGPQYRARFDTRHPGSSAWYDGILEPDGRLVVVQIDSVSGYRRSFTFEPGAAPFELSGHSTFRCSETAVRQ